MLWQGYYLNKTNGALRVAGVGRQTFNAGYAGGSIFHCGFTFNASWSNGTYKDNAHVQPTSISVKYAIKH